MESDTYETSAESASNFMRWIERRLSEEVESNEKHAKEADQPPVITVVSDSINATLSTEEKQAVIARVHTLRDKRKSVDKACKMVGLHAQTYNKWRRSLNIPKYTRQ